MKEFWTGLDLCMQVGYNFLGHIGWQAGRFVSGFTFWSAVKEESSRAEVEVDIYESIWLGTVTLSSTVPPTGTSS